jgi:hypothetical protein
MTVPVGGTGESDSRVYLACTMTEQPPTPEQPPTAAPTRGKRALARYGGIAMFLTGIAASFMVPFVGVPMILFGIVFFLIGLAEPVRD